MAIAFDAATDGGYNGISSPSLTWAHTCTGSDRVLLVGFEGGSGFAAANLITSVTYNGVAMTPVVDMTHASFVHHIYLYILVNPDAGTHNVVLTASGNFELIAGAVSYTGCQQTGQPNAFTNSNTGTSTLTTTVANCWTVLFESGYPGTTTGTPPATERVHDAGFVSWYLFDSNGPVPAGSTSLSTVRVGGSYGVGHLMVALAPSAGGGETAVASADFF